MLVPFMRIRLGKVVFEARYVTSDSGITYREPILHTNTMLPSSFRADFGIVETTRNIEEMKMHIVNVIPEKNYKFNRSVLHHLSIFLLYRWLFGKDILYVSCTIC